MKELILLSVLFILGSCNFEQGTIESDLLENRVSDSDVELKLLLKSPSEDLGDIDPNQKSFQLVFNKEVVTGAGMLQLVDLSEEGDPIPPVPVSSVQFVVSEGKLIQFILPFDLELGKRYGLSITAGSFKAKTSSGSGDENFVGFPITAPWTFKTRAPDDLPPDIPDSVAMVNATEEIAIAGIDLKDINTLSTKDQDGDDLTYTCFYDQSIDGAVASVSSCSDLAGFSLVDGVLNWTPASDAEGLYEMLVIASEGNLSDSVRFIVSVVDGDASPVISNIGNQVVMEKSNLNFDVTDQNSGNDTDADGDTITYSCHFDMSVNSNVATTTLCTSITGVSFDVNTGVFDWTPDWDQAGIYEILVTADEGNKTDTEIFTINVTDNNRAPVLSAISDSTINENVPYSVNAQDDNTTSDNDIDGTALAYSCQANSNPCTNLTGLSFNTTSGELNWTPSYFQSGTYNFSITGSDGSLSDDETFTLTVNNIDRAPVLSAISNQTVNEVVAITQINAQDDNSSADTDIDLEALTYTCTYNGGSPCGGLTGFSLNASTGVMDWTPSYTQAGVYNFTLTASEGDLTDTETFTITVNDVDLPPELSTVSDETVNENVAITSININDTNTSNDTDRDGDTITYTCQVNGSGCGTVSGISFTGATGAMDWTPSFSQAGTYNFVITGSEGDLNDTESFTITVSNIDRAPELFDISDFSVAEGSAITQVNNRDLHTSDDTDRDGDAITYTCQVNGSGCGTVAGVSFVGATGTVDWTPSYTQAGTYDFVITGSEGDLDDTEAFRITVTNTNRAPVLDAIANETVAENSAITAINAADGGDDLDIDLEDIDYTCAVDSAASCVALGVTFDTDSGDLSWTPGFSDAGTHNFTITGSDGSLSDDETFTITVTNNNRAPVLDAIADETVSENSAITAINAADGGDDLDIDNEDIDYTCSVDSAASCVALGVTFDTDNGDLSWTPGFSDAGTHNFTITGSDGSLSDDETFTITVNNTNRAPVLDAIADETVAENSAITAINAADGGDDLDIDNEDIDYTCAVDSAASCVALGVTFDTDTGDLTWTPGFSDAGNHNFTITGSDGSLSDDETFTITVTNNNRSPVLDAIADETVSENSAITAINAADGGDDLDIDLEDIDYTCAVDSAASCVALGVTFDTDNGDLSWTPGFSDAGTHNFTITGSDGSLSDDETFTITVTNNNRAPVLDAIADETVAENSAITAINAADGGDDLDIDLEDIDYTCAVDSAASCVALGVTFDTDNGDLSWTPGFSDAGTHNFTITGSDGSLSDDETFTITVTNNNRAPVLDAIADETVAENSAITAINAADGGDDLDIDLEDIDYTCAVDSAASCVALGVTFDTDNGDLSWTPGFSDAGTHNFTITGSDGSLSDDETFTITVTNNNRAPVLDAIANETVAENSAITAINAADGGDDLDIDNEDIDYTCAVDSAASCVALGVTFDTDSGDLSWTPGFDDAGTHNFTITGSDGSLSDDETFTITVTNTNRPPVLSSISDIVGNELIALTSVDADDTGDDQDADAEALLYSCTFDTNIDSSVAAGTTCSQANLGGTFSFNTATGVFDWTPGSNAYENGDASGRYEFQIVADDQQGAGNSTDSEIFMITIADNIQPAIDAIADDSVAENAALATINAADGGDDLDGDSQALLYSCTYDLVANNDVSAGTACSQANLGGTFSFNTSTGVMDWTPDYDGAGTYEFQIVADDQQGAGNSTDNEIFVVTVTNTNRAPVLDAISNQTIAENAAMTQVNAADGGDDNDIDLEDIDYTCAVDSAASCVALGATFDAANGVLDWTPSFTQAGTHNFTITGSDGSLSDDETFTITVTNTNRPPVLDAISNQTVAENSAITAIDAADGGDDNDVDLQDIDYTCAVDSAASCVALGVTFDANNGTLAWTPGYDNAGTHNFTITGSDGSLSDDETFTITVTNTNRAPVLDAIANETVAENSAITAINAADGGDDLDVDNDDIDYTCAVDSAASCVALGVTFDTDTGDLSWTPGYDDAGTHNFTITGSDGSLSDDEAFTITVNNTNRAPVLDAIADETVAENSAITAIDAADGGDDNDADGQDIDSPGQARGSYRYSFSRS